MFGLPSLNKLLILVAIISAIWFAFRLIGQLDRQRREATKVGKGRGGKKPADRQQVEDMVQCRVCGAFTAARGSACGRANCPYG